MQARAGCLQLAILGLATVWRRLLPGHRRSVAIEDVMAMTKARSLLLILLATCEQTLLALDAAANTLDTDMTEDLRRMIERTHGELAALEARPEALRAEF